MKDQPQAANRPQDRRRRRIARRRQKILSAAAQIFAEKGYANTSTKEIAFQADMGESTLYNYFDSKRDILLAIARETEPLMLFALQEAQHLDGCLRVTTG